MPLKLFNLDTHVSFISDVKDIFDRLYGDKVQITNWSISGDRWVFGFPYVNVKHITQRSWKNLTQEMIEAFQAEYDSVLSQYDGFIVTQTPVFAQIYEKYNKPIIMVNTCRYNQPFCWNDNFDDQQRLNAALKRMAAKGQLFAVSNNKADQEYLRFGTGLESTYIPSLCAYTKEKHSGVAASSVLTYGNRDKFPASENVINKRNGSTWKDMYSHKAIIHYPSEVSSVAISEQYTAGVPLLLPSKDFLSRLVEEDIWPLKSIYMSKCPDDMYDAMEPTFDPQWWIDRADYYDKENMPYIQFYDSPEDAIAKAEASLDACDTSSKEQHLAERQASILAKWDKIFKSAFSQPLTGQIKCVWDQGDKEGFQHCTSANKGQLNQGSLIGDLINNMAQDSSCKNFLEVGTWNGMGSTRCFVNGLKQRKEPYNFWSLECNPEKSASAKKLYQGEENVYILNEVLFNEKPQGIHEKFSDLKNSDCQQWLNTDLQNMSDKPRFLERSDLPEVFDVVLLDGGEFTTFYDFMLLKDRFKTLIVDCVKTSKGSAIKQYLQDNSDKYRIIIEHPERNGFLIAKKAT